MVVEEPKPKTAKKTTKKKATKKGASKKAPKMTRAQALAKARKAQKK